MTISIVSVSKEHGFDNWPLKQKYYHYFKS